MEFDISVWRKYYDRVHELGALMKEVGEETKLELLNDIQLLINKSDQYLDVCRVKRRKKLWHYNKDDERTWESSPKFAYKHLLKY